MDTLTVDQELAGRLHGLSGPLKVLSQEGVELGVFEPARLTGESAYDWARRVITEDELRCSRERGGETPTHAILTRLKSLGS